MKRASESGEAKVPLFEWQGYDLSGQPQRGAIYSDNLAEAQHRLREQGIRPTLLRPVQPRIKLSWWARTVGLRPAPLAQFFQNLYQTVRAGVPLVEALETIGRAPTPLAAVANHAAKRIATGLPLSQAFAETGFAFPPFVIPLIQTGERSGQLDFVLHYLSEHFTREHRYWLMLWGFLMSCPGIYCGCLLVPSWLFVTFVVPKVMLMTSPDPQWAQQFYEKLFGPVRYLIWLVVGFLTLWVLNWALSRNPSTAVWWEGLKMRLPGIGFAQKRLAAARFGRTLAMLYSAGVEPSESLLLAGQSSGSIAITQAARQNAPRLRRGEPFSAVLQAVPLMPPSVIQAVVVGERTGKIDEGLHKAAEMLEREAESVQTGKPVALTIAIYLLLVAAVFYPVLRALLGIADLYLEALRWAME